MSEIYVRGATTVDYDGAKEVSDATKTLLREILKQNSIGIKEIKFVIFTATRDIKSVYPAAATRELGITEAALMCFQEMYVEGSLPLCLRVMLCASVNISKSPRHVYLNNARTLRPDLNPYSADDFNNFNNFNKRSKLDANSD